MKTTEYTESDEQAVQILRKAYSESGDLDATATLCDAFQYLNNRDRYKRMFIKTTIACRRSWFGKGLYCRVGKGGR